MITQADVRSRFQKAFDNYSQSEEIVSHHEVIRRMAYDDRCFVILFADGNWRFVDYSAYGLDNDKDGLKVVVGTTFKSLRDNFKAACLARAIAEEEAIIQAEYEAA